tara:strand:+ start:90 stop:674 length:585 start_codon:yes stop_codon:yes gene_type:complete
MKNILLIVMIGMALTVSSQMTVQEKKVWELSVHLIWQTSQDVTYDGSYRIIDYPNGDVPANIGVCTDVIIRAYRFIGIDLQELVHKSVKKNHKYYYPNPIPGYGMKPDSNIDHRRVIILKKFLKLHHPDSELSYTDSYLPGDIIFWDNWHIGMLTDKKVKGTDRYYCVHNMGSGPVIEDVYYDEYVLQHFRLKF